MASDLDVFVFGEQISRYSSKTGLEVKRPPVRFFYEQFVLVENPNVESPNFQTEQKKYYLKN
jgi:hypothetical protein